MTPTSLEDSYRRCRELTRRSGTTYYWSTYLLPAGTRRHVYAIYGFCRYADDLVDVGNRSVAHREAALGAFGDQLLSDLDRGGSDDPILKAVVHTATTFGIERSCFSRFLKSMAMDLTVFSYPTFDDLMGYVDGSAAVIGDMMLPLLEPSDPSALGPARDLGIAFQLTNFCRDVAEDLDRGRVYLPAAEVERFNAGGALSARRVTSGWADLMAFEIARAREFYASSLPGIALLPPRSARCIHTARTLYSGILDRIEAAGYDVFSQRIRVPTSRKVATAALPVLRNLFHLGPD